MKITLKEATATLIVTLLGISIMVGIFFALSNFKKQQEKDKKTNELIEEIKKQQFGSEEKDDGQEQSGQESQEEAEETKIFNAVLDTFQNDTLVFIDQETKLTQTVYLTQETTIIYNSKPFDKINFYKGDMLEITAKKTKSSNWSASSILVLFSASPKTEAPIPQGLEQRPSGELKPIGNN